MKYLLLLFLFFLLFSKSYGQDYVMNYDWEDKGKQSKLSPQQRKKDFILLTRKNIIQYFYDDEDKLVEYDLFHTRKYLGSKTSIAENNKIYIPLDEGEELIKTKARVILPTGKIINLDKSNIKEGVSSETNTKYKFFALKGLVPGSEIEYMYVRKVYPSYRGTFITMQQNDTTYNQVLQVISPQNLIMVSKSYNGLPAMKIDTSLAPLNFLNLSIDTLPGLKFEPATYMEKHFGKVAFKLDKNKVNYKANIVDYGEIARGVYSYVNVELGKKDEKAIGKIFKDAELNKKESATINLRKLENYLKKNYSFQGFGGEETILPSLIYVNKVYTQIGVMRIYSAICKLLNIKMQPVLTCDRTEMNFDKKFATYNFIKKMLIYFPEIDLYLDPEEKSSRLGLIGYEYTGVVGMHIKAVSMGDYSTGVAVFKKIPPSSAESNLRKITVNVSFGNDFQSCNAHYKIESSGLMLNEIQHFYKFISEEDQKEVRKSLLEFYDDFKATNIKITNASSEFIGQQPLIVEGDVTSESFLQIAGNKVLFHIGKLIGKQVEMYSNEKDKRTLPIEDSYNRSFYRTIIFNIPKGYKPLNLESLNKNLSFQSKAGEVVLKFKSSYTINENKVVLILDEAYHKIELAPEMFSKYLKVVNAAADFNKIVLVFEKKAG